MRLPPPLAINSCINSFLIAIRFSYLALLRTAFTQSFLHPRFVGTSENALRMQLWTALVAILLLQSLHHLSKAKWSLSNLASMLRLNLFTYRDLTAWLDHPFGTPPTFPESQQLTFALA